MSKLANDILEALNEGDNSASDNADLLREAAKILDSYSFVASRKIVKDKVVMDALKLWAPNHYQNICSDTQ